MVISTRKAMNDHTLATSTCCLPCSKCLCYILPLGPINQCNMKPSHSCPVTPVCCVTPQPTVVFHSVHNHEVSSHGQDVPLVWDVEDAKQHLQ